MTNYCCTNMENKVYITGYKSADEKVICYIPKYREYGIPCSDEISMIQIYHCPWCGKKLPTSLREQWFDELEKLGFDSPLLDDSIPQKYKTDIWWHENIN